MIPDAARPSTDSGRCPAFDGERSWYAVLHSAEAASWLAPLISENPGLDAQGAQAAGLLHSLGLLWMAHQIPELPHQALEATAADSCLSVAQTLDGGCAASTFTAPDSG